MQIFLSHATSDSGLVAQVKTALSPLVTVYCTEDDGQAGVNVHTKIQEQIRKSDFMIVLLSNSGAESIYLHQEIGFARSADKLIIPVVSVGVTSHKLGMLEGLEYIQIDNTDDWLARLSSRVDMLVRAEAEALVRPRNEATLTANTYAAPAAAKAWRTTPWPGSSIAHTSPAQSSASARNFRKSPEPRVTMICPGSACRQRLSASQLAMAWRKPASPWGSP